MADNFESWAEELRKVYTDAIEKQVADRPHLEYSQEGRGGTVTYIAGTTKINFDWEFAGNRMWEFENLKI